MRGCAAALMVCSYTFMDRSSNSALVSKCSRQDNAQGIRCETRQQEVSVKFAQQKRRTDFDAMRTYCIVQGCQHRTSGARQHSNVTYLCICLSLGLLLMSASVCLSLDPIYKGCQMQTQAAHTAAGGEGHCSL